MSLDKSDEGKLLEIHESLALAVNRLGDAAPSLAIGAKPVLGMPPATAPPLAMPLAQLLSRQAAPVALSAPTVAASVPAIAPALRR
jgi:hypothetical protein